MAVIQTGHKAAVVVTHVDVPQVHQSTVHVDRSENASAITTQHHLMRLRYQGETSTQK